jgi:hypothetical protein
MNDEQQDMMDAQEASTMRSASQQTGLRMAAEQKQHTIHNEDFLNELRKADLDSDHLSWIKEEYPEWFSGAHAVTNRGDDWDMQADLIMMNKRERAVAQERPGRLLRDRPFMLAAMRGDQTPPADAYNQPGVPGSMERWRQIVAKAGDAFEPITPEERRAIYGSAEVAADLMTLSRNAAGLDSVSTVKTETNVRREEEEESTASRVGRVFE